MKKSHKIIVFIFGFIILVLLALPIIVKRYAINHSKELVGRQIQIDKLKYNYFTSTIKVFDFKMLEENEQDNFITFDTLIVNIEPLALIKDKIEIEDFYLKGLDVKVIMKDSTFNFDDLVAFHATEEDSITQNTEEEAFKFSISNIDIKESDFHFNNQDIDHTTNIENLSFLVPFIGWDQEEKSNADVKFNFPRGGYLESKLNINPINGEYDATLIISDLYLDPFYEYVAEYATINSFKGRLNSIIKIDGNTNEAINAIVSGKVEVNDFEMTDTNDKKFLSAKKIEIVLKKIDYANSAYIIDSLRIKESYTFFQLDSITNNFYSIFKVDEETESSQTETKSNHSQDSLQKTSPLESDLYYAINHLKVTSGVLDYTDNLTGNPFDYHLSDIKINADSILSDADWVKINSDMLLNNRGTLNAAIGFNPSTLNDADIDIVVENFLLSDLNIYTKHYTGHNIIEGDMYYYSNSKITNGDIVSENKLLVKNVSLNNTKGGLYSLPLKFALFLLKDKNGDVNLEIPVRGDLNDPQVRVGKIVWNTFKNLIVKTVASPVNFLAGLVDGDPKEMEAIKFSYLDSIPTEKHYKQLDKILELEQKKPGLKIEMNYFVDRNFQKEAIAKQEMGIQYFKDTQKDYLKDVKGFEAYLQNKIGNDSITADKAAVTIIGNEKLNELVLNQNNNLISKIRDYIKPSQESSLILINIVDPKDLKNKGLEPIFKIDYGMQEDNFVKN